MRKFIGKVGFFDSDRVQEYHIRARTVSRAYAKVRNRFLKMGIMDDVEYIKILTMKEFWRGVGGHCVVML